MTGRMIEFDTNGTPAPGYLATPDSGAGPGVVVLHEWWGLTEPFRQACDWLAEAGFMALAPDLYRGKTTATVEEAEGVERGAGSSRWSSGAATSRARCGSCAKTARPSRRTVAARSAFSAFSLGGAYALDMSVNLADEIAAVVTFYATYPGLDYRARRRPTSATSPRMTPMRRRRWARRWSRSSRRRAGRPPSIPIQGPNTGSSGPIARMPTMPPPLPWHGSEPSPS